ncbi:MAG TPA: DUF4157 domain-containing protein [Kofleriaceae bacterium]|jgi:outer membrane protein OmpA-like peptidoglycan-associated protein|nr:DUF4157 domain-containing protein [Kofleriaceae bacterium]
MRRPEFARGQEREQFDPVVDGARLGLSRELSLAIWDRASRDAAGGAGPPDADRAQRRFRELAAQARGDGGRPGADVGRLTRAETELGELPRGAWATGAPARYTPGKTSLVAAEARSRTRGGPMPAPGRQTLVGDDGPASSPVHRAARAGIRGDGGALPYAPQIQASFGRHDISTIRAHVGGAATAAARSIGARAYAFGDDVVFAATPDLRQAAHEAAHVIQQRRGVALDGGVGRAGDRYEQHAEAVAAHVMRGESAEAVLDAMSGGGAARAAVQCDDERTRFQATGRYADPSGDVLVEINQAGHLIVGHYQSRRDGYLGRGDLAQGTFEGDIAWDNTGSSGYRFHATPTRPSTDRPFSGRMVVSAGGQLRIERDGVPAIVLHRTDEHAYIPADTAGTLPAADASAVAAPLTAPQRTSIAQLRTQVETAVRGFYDAGRDVRGQAAISTLDAQVREAWHAIPAAQQPAFRAAVRDELAAHRIRVEGFVWSDLDWLQAVCMQLDDPAVARDIHDLVGVQTGTAAAGDGDTVYRYRIGFVLVGAGAELAIVEGGEAQAHVGIMHVSAGQPYRRSEHPTPPPFVERWHRNYELGRVGAGVEAGASIGGDLGEAGEGEVISPFPWEPLDFQGPVGGGGIEGSLGTSGLLGGLQPAQYQDQPISLAGSGIYPPLDLTNVPTQDLGQQGGAAVSVGGSAGYAVDLAPDLPFREPIVDQPPPHGRPVVGEGHVSLAFRTGSHALTPAGREAVRRVLALNRRFLESGDGSIEVLGHASPRRHSPRYSNQALSQRRADTVATACREIMPELPLRVTAIGRGTALADADGATATENHWLYRRADIVMAGVVVLQLHGDAASDGIEIDRGIATDHDPDLDPDPDPTPGG